MADPTVKAREVQYELRPLPRTPLPDLLPFLLAEVSPSVRVETTLARTDEAGNQSRIIDITADAKAMPAAKRILARYHPANAVEKTVLAETPHRLLAWYKYEPRGNPSGFSNSALLFQTIGRDATITDVTRSRTMVVRVLAHTGRSLRPFLSAVEEASQEAFEFRLDYIGPPRLPTRGGLTPVEDRLLRMALAAGYFAVPRQASLAAVARQAGVSASTLSSVLRVAAEKLARNWVKSS